MPGWCDISSNNMEEIMFSLSVLHTDELKVTSAKRLIRAKTFIRFLSQTVKYLVPFTAIKHTDKLCLSLNLAGVIMITVMSCISD